MAGYFFYRRVRATGIWHILRWEYDVRGDGFRALCGEECTQSSEGYKPNGKRADPPGVCPQCKLIADGAKQLALLEEALGV